MRERRLSKRDAEALMAAIDDPVALRDEVRRCIAALDGQDPSSVVLPDGIEALQDLAVELSERRRR